MELKREMDLEREVELKRDVELEREVELEPELGEAELNSWTHRTARLFSKMIWGLWGGVTRLFKRVPVL